MGKVPRIGVGVIIRKGNKILLGKRKNSHGAGLWCPPGGHLEFMESIEDCAKRETSEETGLEIENVQSAVYTEDFYSKENLHYITMLVTSDWSRGEPQNLEKDKCEGWQWFLWDEIPESLCVPLQNHIDQGYSPFK